MSLAKTLLSRELFLKVAVYYDHGISDLESIRIPRTLNVIVILYICPYICRNPFRPDICIYAGDNWT